MCDILLWIYLFNAILIIMHEIDSGYWKEWELFRMKGGITFFLLLYIPLLFVVLYGLTDKKNGFGKNPHPFNKK